MARDWVDWHDAYERPESSLVTRLAVVIDLLRASIDAAPAGPVRCLSLCAGEARDLEGALRGHPRAEEVSGAVVELDARLADRARQRLADTPSLDVRVADAGDPTSFVDVLPVDVLLLVGVFGNISDDDIRASIAAVPTMCRPGASVIWTRHRRAPDATPMIRAAFDSAGCTEQRFVSPGAGQFAIGSHRFGRPDTEPPAEAAPLSNRLFTFRDDLW